VPVPPAPTPAGSLPWVEDFSLADGTKVDTGATSWTASRATGNFDVRNGVLRVNDNGDEAVLTTGEITTNGSTVSISVDVVSEGNLETNQDYVKLFAKVDGGSEVLIGEKVGNQVPTTTITGTISTGSKLVLVIRTYVSYISESYFIDNLTVTTSAPVAVPVPVPIPAPVPVPVMPTPPSPPTSPTSMPVAAAAAFNAERNLITTNNSYSNTVKGKAELWVMQGVNGVQQSNYGANSFKLTNTGPKRISAVFIDCTSAMFQDSK